MTTKAQLRESALRARAGIGREQRAAKSALIAGHLQGWQAFRHARALCLYASFGSEVQTDGLLAALCGRRQPSSPPPAAESVVCLSCERDAPPPPRVTESVVCLPRVEGSELRLHRLTPEIMRKAVFGAFAAEQILSASALAVEQASLASGLIAEPAASGTGSSTKQPASATGSTEKQPASATGSAEKQPANGTGSSTKQPARATGSAARQPSGLPQTSSTAATLWAGLELSPMGMPEPLASLPLVPPQALDLIFVPGSAFCLRSGHRLGYGKGFYDRLLAQAPQALKVGLGFDVQLFDMPDFPADAHDIALDVLVSESGIHDLRRGTSPVNP